MIFSILKKVPFKGKIEIVDSDGNIHSFGESEAPYIKIRFKNKKIQRKIFYNPNLYIGEGYMNNEIVVEEGSIDEFLNIITASYNDLVLNHWFLKIFDKSSIFFRKFQQFNNIFNSRKNVAHHYDLNEDLYRLFLDEDMQYSCGYFYNDNISLQQAQIDKKNHIIKKLNIQQNMSVLDIGSGWGGLALQIAKDTGAKVKGITLSKNQLETANQRAQKEGLNEKVKFELIDYRQEKESFDRIVSVGMFEHVGVNYFADFFSKIYKLLNDNGVCLLHTIGYTGKPASTNPWIRKYIFPGGYIPSLSEIVKVCENEKIIITDIEVLRLHYAKTLQRWYDNVKTNKNKIVKMYDERFYRMWEFYLLASKYSFINMGNVVFQLQISKNVQNLPLIRNYMYN
tara:strand:- start:2590 stop:3777 length:1188 start_codon:yes stop_codon:yes gene_type:complete